MATTNPLPAPRRGIPLWAKVIAAIFVVLLLIALAVPYVLNVDRYRGMIEEAIATQTGRKVTLGPLRAQVFPGIGLTVGGLHIGNPPGFPESDFVSAEEIRINVAIGPLLHRVIHVNSVDLISPKVALLTDSTGKDNYTFTPASSGQSAPAGADPQGSSSVSLDQVDTINLSKAEVSVGSVSRGGVTPTADTKGINMSIHNFAISPVRVHDWKAESNLSGVTLALEGFSEPVSFESGEVTIAEGKMDAQFVANLATAADVKGTLSVPDVEHPEVDFELSSSKLDIDRLMAVAGGAAPTASSSNPPAADPPAATAKSKSASSAPVKGKIPAAAKAPSAPSELLARGHINVQQITSKPYTVG
ncbi:MAG: AsmA family protein, partial [Candidatus Acidiferrales bacterium]